MLTFKNMPRDIENTSLTHLLHKMLPSNSYAPGELLGIQIKEGDHFRKISVIKKT